VGVIGGRQVRCVTPQLQVRHHLGYPLRATDRHDLGLLAARFGVAVPPTIQLPRAATGQIIRRVQPRLARACPADLRPKNEGAAGSWLPSH
jgi:hypothetical protein